MKTLLQVVLAIAIVVACARGGEAAWRYYQLKDAVAQELLFERAKTTSQLRQKVYELAGEHNVALEYDDIVVSVRGNQAVVDVSYVEAIALVPGIYTREQPFEFQVSQATVRPLVNDER